VCPAVQRICCHRKRERERERERERLRRDGTKKASIPNGLGQKSKLKKIKIK